MISKEIALLLKSEKNVVNSVLKREKLKQKPQSHLVLRLS